VGQPFTITERVRWIDCDAAHIIYYGAYIRFFEIAETEMYRSVGLPYSVAFREIECFPIRAEYHSEYRFPAQLDDLMRIEVWISHWGRTSFTISFRFKRDEDDILLSEGYCRLVCVGRNDKRSISIPDRLKEALAPYTDRERSWQTPRDSDDT